MKRPDRFINRPAMMVTLSLIALTALGQQARAEEGSASESTTHAPSLSNLSQEGLALYKARDYRHAVEKFLQAYALDQDPNLLFNMARCYEGIGDRENALEKYEAFIAKPDADAQGKQRAAEAIRKLRQAKTRPGDQVGATSSTSLQPSTSASKDLAANRTPPASEREEHSFLSAPIVLLGSGVVVTAAGVIAYAMGASDHNKVTGSSGFGMAGQVDPMTQAGAQSLVDSGKTKKLIGGIAMGVGGALMATSAVLFAIEPSHATANEAGSHVAFGATPLTSGGALLVQGRF